MEKAFDRVFARAQAGHEKSNESEAPLHKRPRVEKEDEENRMRLDNNPMVAKDAIQRVLLAEKDKDYFRMLELPLPDVDELGRPVWSCTSGDVSRAYRRLSVLVHPDKNPGDDARQAFEALSTAQRILKDRGGLEEVLKQHLETARQRREKAEACATPQERLAMYASQNVKRKELRKQEGATLQAEILRQQQKRLHEARYKKQLQAKSRRKAEEDDAEIDDEDQEPPPKPVYQSAVVQPKNKKRKPIRIF
eukprot:jgi/Botrbrau1/4104/Bobra.152_3s0052.1